MNKEEPWLIVGQFFNEGHGQKPILGTAEGLSWARLKAYLGPGQKPIRVQLAAYLGPGGERIQGDSTCVLLGNENHSQLLHIFTLASRAKSLASRAKWRLRLDF